jgi:polyphosphate kinase 2 (PPK2 family)
VAKKAKSGKAKSDKASVRVSDLLRVRPGPVDLDSYDSRATPGFDGDKAAAKEELVELGARLADLQERLYAHGRTGDQRRLLLVLQGMDTSGKGGAVRHVVGSGDPTGLSITSFKAPTREERAHDFLWRIRRALPEPGHLGVFDRSQYEDVLVVRVKDLVERRVWGAALRHDQPLRGGARGRRLRGDQGHAAHLAGGAAGAVGRQAG